jgi:hypothetical protein
MQVYNCLWECLDSGFTLQCLVSLTEWGRYIERTSMQSQVSQSVSQSVLESQRVQNQSFSVESR